MFNYDDILIFNKQTYGKSSKSQRTFVDFGLNCNHPLICNVIHFGWCTIVLYHCHGGYIWLDDSVKKKMLSWWYWRRQTLHLYHTLFYKFALRVFIRLLKMQREYWAVEKDVKKVLLVSSIFQQTYIFWLFLNYLEFYFVRILIKFWIKFIP